MAYLYSWHAALCAHEGNGLWLNKTKTQCLVLWKKLPDWAKEIHQWAQSIGLEDSVTTVEEISQGEDCRGTGDALVQIASTWD